MSIRFIRTIQTPWAPYAVTFSRDGTRLAVGGGSWYGDGGIVIVDVGSVKCTPLDWRKVPGVTYGGRDSHAGMVSGVPSVSGLCFSDDDRFLAASMWASTQTYAPAVLFQVDDTDLNPVGVFDFHGLDPFLHPTRDDLWCRWATPTGVLLHESYVIVRQHGGEPAGRHVIVLNPLPADSRVRAGLASQHLTHSRLVAIRGSVITEAGGNRGIRRRQHDGSYAPVPAPEGLAIRRLDQPSVPTAVLPVEDCRRVTAIATLPGNRGFVTGGSDGQIDEWSWDGGWRQRRIRSRANARDPRSRLESIEAVVTVATNQLVAVSTAGDVVIQRRDGQWDSERLPERGSPRSLAAHPHEPWVAVGLKQGGFAEPESAIVLLEVGS